LAGAPLKRHEPRVYRALSTATGPRRNRIQVPV